jgi:modulator of FtsH protease
MIPSLQKTYDTSAIQATRHRVLRNTYWLLALSMIPTVLGAFIGMQTRLPIMSGGLGLILFLAVAFGFIFAIEKTKNSAAGVPVLLGFTFFMGLMLTPLLRYTLGFSNGGALIMGAFGGTAVVFAAMATVATVSKRDFSGMGSWLFAGTIVLILASVANIFLHLAALHLVVLVTGDGHLLGLADLRRPARHQWRRDQLHLGHPVDLPRPVQHLHRPAPIAGHRLRQPRLSGDLKTGLMAGFFCTIA